MKQCDCTDRIGIKVETIKQFNQLKEFFCEKTKENLFEEIKVTLPYYEGHDRNGNIIKWYADRWYRCKICGTIWEFQYPEFPACGEVRKINLFEDK